MSEISKQVGNITPKNFLMNAGFHFAQRVGPDFSLAHSPVVTGQYNFDRWLHISDGSGFNYQTEGSTDIPTDLPVRRSYNIGVNTAKASLAAGDSLQIRQRVEGFVFSLFRKKFVTFSVYVKTNKAGIYSVSFFNDAHDDVYAASIEVLAGEVDTWVRKQVVVELQENFGTWNVDNTIGLQVCVCLAAGSNFHVGSVGQWVNESDKVAVSTQVNLLDSTSNYFRMTAPMLNVGSKLVPFELFNISQEEELNVIQRYYEKSYDLDAVPGSVTIEGIVYHRDAADLTGGMSVLFHVRKRANPTVTPFSEDGTINQWNTGGNGNQTAAVPIQSTSRVVITNQGTAEIFWRGHFTADAEL